MKQQGFQQTHFVGVPVTEALADEVAAFRAWMAQRYGCRSGHGTPPHITLVPPFALPGEYGDDDVRGAVLEAVRSCCAAGILPLPVHVRGFGAFSARTLFAAVEGGEGWDALRAAMHRQLSRAMPGALRAANRPFCPHLTIANRDIPPDAMDEALRHFSRYGLDESFTAGEVAVYRRTARGGWELDALCAAE